MEDYLQGLEILEVITTKSRRNYADSSYAQISQKLCRHCTGYAEITHTTHTWYITHTLRKNYKKNYLLRASWCV